MHTDLSLKEIQKEWHGTLKSYLIGFAVSLVLSITSFVLVASQILPANILSYTIVGLALAQAVFQLIFFLHLGQEAHPRWELLTFYFMILILLIIVVGTLWIMGDLNQRMMSDMTEAMKT